MFSYRKYIHVSVDFCYCNMIMIMVVFRVEAEKPVYTHSITYNNTQKIIYTYNAPINCWPHYPPWGSGWGRVGIWPNKWLNTPPFGQVRWSNPLLTLVPVKGLDGDLIKSRVKSPTLGAHLPFKTESNPLVFPTCSPRGDSRASYW